MEFLWPSHAAKTLLLKKMLPGWIGQQKEELKASFFLLNV